MKPHRPPVRLERNGLRRQSSTLDTRSPSFSRVTRDHQKVHSSPLGQQKNRPSGPRHVNNQRIQRIWGVFTLSLPKVQIFA